MRKQAQYMRNQKAIITNRIAQNQREYAPTSQNAKPIMDNSTYVFQGNGKPIDLKSVDARKASKITRLGNFVSDFDVPEFSCRKDPVEVRHLEPGDVPVKIL